MSIFKVKKKTRDFTIISNKAINDKRLSFKARGVLFYLLSKPDNWETRITDIINSSDKDGEVAIKNALKELRNLGYAKLVRGEFNGKLGSFYEIYEEPQTLP